MGDIFVLPEAVILSFKNCFSTVPDPDLEIGGEGGGHPDPLKKGGGGGGGLQKIFYRPFGPQFGLKIRGACPLAPPPDPSLIKTNGL